MNVPRALAVLPLLALAVVPVAVAAPAGAQPAAAATNDGRFTLAVLPDTQQEVLSGTDTRFADRMQWLAARRDSLDLRYVTSVGDVVNWDTADHIQYTRTNAGMRTLAASGVPWSFSIGNHDTMATGPGGSARPGGNAATDLRVTTTFNSYFGTAKTPAERGTYEAGKIDNSFSTFSAEGHRWMVLNLELWPRPGAVAWAQRVVAARPDVNVIVVSHHVLEADGSIGQTNGGYGATSPRYLVTNLLDRYSNIKLVFSGHTGTTAHLERTGVHGNKVAYLLTTYHSNDTNPVRLVQVDTADGLFRTWVNTPSNAGVLADGSSLLIDGMTWV